VLVPYSLVTRRIYFLQQDTWSMVLFDRPDRIESLNSQTVKAFRLLTAHYRLSILDEPWQKHMQKLWLHFDLVMPGVFCSARQFNQLFLQSEKTQRRRTSFIKLIQPFMIGAGEIFNRRPEQNLRWAGNKRERDMNVILDVLLTDTPMKVLVAKYEFKNTGSIREIVCRFTWRMMRRGAPKWEEWRKSRRKRSAADRQELIELLLQRFGTA
jgi:hypothetical protein